MTTAEHQEGNTWAYLSTATVTHGYRDQILTLLDRELLDPRIAEELGLPRAGRQPPRLSEDYLLTVAVGLVRTQLRRDGGTTTYNVALARPDSHRCGRRHGNYAYEWADYPLVVDPTDDPRGYGRNTPLPFLHLAPNGQGVREGSDVTGEKNWRPPLSYPQFQHLLVLVTPTPAERGRHDLFEALTILARPQSLVGENNRLSHAVVFQELTRRIAVAANEASLTGERSHRLTELLREHDYHGIRSRNGISAE